MLSSRYTSCKFPIDHYKSPSDYASERVKHPDDLLWRSREVSIVRARAVLHAHEHSIVGAATLFKIVTLEVKGRLRESISVGNIVNSVDDIKRVRPSSVDVRGYARGHGGVIRVIEDKVISRLGGDVGLGALVGDDVVAAVDEKQQSQLIAHVSVSIKVRGRTQWW